MRSLCISLFFLFTVSLSAQPWMDIPPGERQSEEKRTFFDYQKAFTDYWAPRNVGPDGYYLENGTRKKAAGWKLFKRWEHFWESRVDPVTGAFPTKQQYERAQRAFDESKPRTDDGNWTNMGPWDSWGGYWGVGRVNHIAFHPDDPNTFWVTTPQGGVWMTQNGGTDWTPLTDDQEVMATTGIAVDPDFSQTQTLYVGTGEMDAREHSGGVGVIKSTDGGYTWSPTGLTFSPGEGISVNKILIHPVDHQIVYAATTDGIFKSANGGITWDWIYTEPYICDLEFKPGDPSILFASNKYWGRIYKLTNNGTNVQIVYNEYDNGAYRIELAVCPSIPSRIYAVVVNADGGLFSILRSLDSGSQYAPIFTPGPSLLAPNILSLDQYGENEGGQGYYDLALIVDPNNADHLYCGGINTWESFNGGISWTLNNFWTDYYCPTCEIAHADKHYFAYNGNTLYEANDGGLYKTLDGQNWAVISDGIVNSQLYKLGVSRLHPQHILTGLQDNGVKRYHEGTWTNIEGADGMEVFYNPQDENCQYYILQNGFNFNRTDNNWQTRTDIKPEGSEGTWTTPYLLKRWDANTIYAGFQHIYKSTDRGNNWTIIFNQNSESRFRCIDIPSNNDQYIWASDAHSIWRTTNGGSSWTDITSNLPPNLITDIETDPFDFNKAWVTLGSFDEHVVYQTIDGGTSWTNISAGLPPVPANSIIKQWFNLDNDELYVGTDFGVYVKIGDNNWQSFNNGMPKVSVRELEISYMGRGKEGDRDAFDLIRAATYGRGLWESNCYSVGSAPVCDFTANKTMIGPGEVVQFTDLSLNGGFRNWVFEGGVPSWSNDANPQVRYDDPGVYPVQLTVNNAHGTCEKTVEDYIRVVCADLNYKAEKAQSLQGTYLDLGTLGSAITTANKDDANSSPVNIGFAFDFNCQSFTQFVLNTNGFIRLGNQPPSRAALFYDAATGNDNGLFNSTHPNDVNIICPFNHDLESAGNAEYRVHTSGTAPNRVCTIQFEGIREKTTNPVRQFSKIEFQIKLYETTNQIEFIYGNWIPAGNPSAYKSAAGGLKGSSSDDGDLLVVGKNSTEAWSDAYFDNANYLPGGYGLNFGAPPDRPKPDNGRTYRFTPVYFDDNRIAQIYALGTSSTGFSNPQTIGVLVHNTGYLEARDLDVQLVVSGANPYFDIKTIEQLAPGDSQLVEFEGYMAQNPGTSVMTATIPEDFFPEDNTLSWTQTATPNEINFANDDPVFTGFGYQADYSGTFLTKYEIKGTSQIQSVAIFLFNFGTNPGQQVSAVLVNENGALLAESMALTMGAEHLNKWHTFSFANPPTVSDATVLAGLKQYLSTTGTTFYPLAVQEENPTRLNTYYYGDANGNNLVARNADFGYRYMIGISLLPQYQVGMITADHAQLCQGETVILQLSSPDAGIQWQSSADGLQWMDIPGAQSIQYTSEPLITDKYFRAEVTFPDQSILHSNELFIKVYPVFQREETVLVCPGDDYSFPDGTVVSGISEETTHTSHLETQYGCDSLIETTIQLHPAYSLSEDVFVCSGDSYTFPDGTTMEHIAEPVSHTSLFQTTEGCDSTILTSVGVYEVYEYFETIDLCRGDDYTFPDGNTLSSVESDVNHESRLLTMQGCDSIIHTQLTVLPDYFLTEEVTLCSGDAYTFPDGTVVSQILDDRVHLSELLTVGYCDSLIQTFILIEPVFEYTEEVTVCAGDDYVFPDGHLAQNILSGYQYQSDLLSQAGCDSIIQTIVDVIELGVGITSLEGTLIAFPNDLSYQWLDCDTHFEAVPGATEQNFQPYASGNYCVVGTDGICLDTSECVYVIGTGTKRNSDPMIRVYPNPVRQKLVIESPEVVIMGCSLTSIHGNQLTPDIAFTEKSRWVLMMPEGQYPKGIYILQVFVPNGQRIFRVAVQ